MIMAATGMIWLVRCWQNRKIVKEALAPFGVSFLCGLLVVCVEKRLTDEKMAAIDMHERGDNAEPLIKLICDNSVLFFVLSVVVILIVCKYRKRLSARSNVIWLMHLAGWSMLLLCNLLLCGINIYDDLKEKPEQMVRGWYGWVNVTNANVDGLIESFLNRFGRMLPIFLLLAVGSLIHLLCAMGKELAGISLIFTGIAGTAISVLGLESGSRITASAVFSLIAVIAFLAGDILKEGGKGVKKAWLGVYIAVCVFAMVSADHMFTFLAIQNRVTVQRREIAKEIEIQQHIGKWEYDSFAVMPEYKKIGSKGFFQLSRTNPSNKDDWYSVLLYYYNLDQDTKILFTDSDTQLIKWTDEQDNVRLRVNLRKPYESYRFQVLEEGSSGNEIPVALGDSGWIEKNEWILPKEFREKQDVFLGVMGKRMMVLLRR